MTAKTERARTSQSEEQEQAAASVRRVDKSSQVRTGRQRNRAAAVDKRQSTLGGAKGQKPKVKSMVQADRIPLMKEEVYPCAMPNKQYLSTRTAKHRSGDRAEANRPMVCKVLQ